MTSKWLWTLKGHWYPVYVLHLPSSRKFHSISLHGYPFSNYRQFWDKCTEWTHNNPEQKDTPKYRYQLPRSPTFTPFHSTFSHFGVTCHFETSAPNKPKMTLNTKRSKVSHILMRIYLTLSPNFHPVYFALWLAMFELPATLTQVHPMIPKWH